jgi:hypothetical protein
MTELEQYIEFVAADNALSPEEKAQLQKLLSKDKVKDRVKDGYLMRQDYSRKTAEVATARKKLDEDHKRLLEWEKQAREKVEKLNSDLEARNVSLAQYQARMQRIADDYGIEIKDLPGMDGNHGTAAAAAAAESQQGGAAATDPKFMERFETFEKQFQTAGRAFPEIAAELYELGIEHQELFGKPLKNSRELVKKAMGGGLTLRAAWEQDHKVPERRNEILREQIRGEEREKIEAEFRQRTSELTLGGDRTKAPTPESPVLSRNFKPQIPDSAAGNGDGTTAAAAHQDTGGRSDAERETGGGAMRAAQLFLQRRAQRVPMGKEAQ